MNPTRYILLPSLFILLITPLTSDGSIILAILLKIMFLKGALFLGTPMAIGSFLMGQGIGFLGGGLAGSWTILKASHKYHQKEKAKWVHYHRRPVYRAPKPPGLFHRLKYGPPPPLKYGSGNRRSRPRRPRPPPPPPKFSSHPTTYYSSSGPDFITSSDAHGLSFYKTSPAFVSDHSASGSTNGGGTYTSFSPRPGPSSSSTHYHYHRKPQPQPVAEASSSSSSGSHGHGYSSNSAQSYQSAPSVLSTLTHLPSILKEIRSKPPPAQLRPGPIKSFYESYTPGEGYFESPGPGGSSDFGEMESLGYYGGGGGGGGMEFSAPPPPAPKPSTNHRGSPHHRPPQQQSSQFMNNFEFFESPAPDVDNASPDFEDYPPLSSPNFEMDPSIAYDVSDSYPFAMSPERRVDPSSLKKGQQQELLHLTQQSALDTVPSTTLVPAPTQILVRYIQAKLEEKSRLSSSDKEKAEAKQLISLLRQAYLQELEKSMVQFEAGVDDLDSSASASSETSERVEKLLSDPQPRTTPTLVEALVGIPSFKTLPTFTPKPPLAATVAAAAAVNATATATAAEGSRNKRQSTNVRRNQANLRDNVAQVLKKTSAQQKFGGGGGASQGSAAYLPKQLGDAQGSFSTRIKNTTSTRAPAAPPPSAAAPSPSSSSSEQIDEEILLQFKLIQDEIQQFFLILSLLDHDQCLQKLVCDVHARSTAVAGAATAGAGGELTDYEKNILQTFRILNFFLNPTNDSTVNKDDSTSLYRLASRLGELSQSAQICQSYYSKCSYSPLDIIKMGSDIEKEGRTGLAAAAASPGTGADQMEAAGSVQRQQWMQAAAAVQQQWPTTESSSASFVTMPKV